MSPTPNKKKQIEFLAEYKRNGAQQGKAAEKVGVDRSSVSRWLRDYPDFKKKYEDVELDLCEAVEATIKHIALTERNLTALFGLAKRLMPELWDDNIRKCRWLKSNDMTDPDARQPVQVVLVRGDEPERLKKKDNA